MPAAKPRRRGPIPTHWVYAYQLQPPQPDAQFNKIKVLLRRAHFSAGRADRMWAGRIVLQTQVSHILIVSDTPSLQRAANRALEAQLKRQGVRFSVSQPVSLPLAT